MPPRHPARDFREAIAPAVSFLTQLFKDTAAKALEAAADSVLEEAEARVADAGSRIAKTRKKVRARPAKRDDTIDVEAEPEHPSRVRRSK